MSLILDKCGPSDKNANYETCIFESSTFGICTCNYGQKIVNNQVVCQGIVIFLEEFLSTLLDVINEVLYYY